MPAQVVEAGQGTARLTWPVVMGRAALGVIVPGAVVAVPGLPGHDGTFSAFFAVMPSFAAE